MKTIIVKLADGTKTERNVQSWYIHATGWLVLDYKGGRELLSPLSVFSIWEEK